MANMQGYRPVDQLLQVSLTNFAWAGFLFPSSTWCGLGNAIIHVNKQVVQPIHETECSSIIYRESVICLNSWLKMLMTCKQLVSFRLSVGSEGINSLIVGVLFESDWVAYSFILIENAGFQKMMWDPATKSRPFGDWRKSSR